MPSESNPMIPIANVPHQSPTHNFKGGEKTTSRNDGNCRRMVRYGCCALGIAVIAAAVILALSFTVFKVREPTMRINAFNFGKLDLARNLTVVADVSVRNPNALTFTFGSSETSLLYRDAEVGTARGPPGTVGARRTLRTNVTVDVIMGKLLGDSSFVGEVRNGTLGLQTRTAVGGRVKILGMFRHHVDVVMNCTVSVSIAGREILDQRCTQRMWL